MPSALCSAREQQHHQTIQRFHQFSENFLYLFFYIKTF
ncbi:hypothetical protein BURMUCF1_0717 [Burkholderia multivorans ATCC BAA-247]|nr:hypothetical protein BURMUCGD1_2536 [Burkholderia multivorans CGD1]EJO61229.1 hypothetical protein BURMUCF1_0717 [Burkholderia multivorans ATCC BAA-247]